MTCPCGLPLIEFFTAPNGDECYVYHIHSDKLIEEVRGLRQMTSYSGRCNVCGGLGDWIDCPTGGWWAHRTHPADGHDAETGWRPMERQNDSGEWETQ